MTPQLPSAFIDQIGKTFSTDESDNLLASFSVEPNVSIRLNSAKGIMANHIVPGLVEKAIVHCNDGFLLRSRPNFTSDPMFHAGAYYVQEANSMAIGVVIEKLIQALPKGAVVLDLCGAPGGKSTHIASKLRPGDILVANEVIASRSNILVENLCKWGMGNHLVTSTDSKRLGQLEGLFQIVVADMPCSGEGMFRKNPSSINEWSPNNVLLCKERQQRIAHDIWPSIAEGGFLVYSTCTFNAQENEDNVKHLINALGTHLISIPEAKNWGAFELQNNMYRMMPHRTDGEGLFFAVLQKSSAQKLKLPRNAKLKSSKNLPNWLNDKFMGYELRDGLMCVRKGDWFHLIPDLPALLPGIKQTGINLGMANKNQWKIHPAYDLLAIKPTPYSTQEISPQQAIQYFKREFLPMKSYNKGVVGLRLNGFPLGTANSVTNGLNNLWPMGWRILQSNIQANSILSF